MNTKTSLSVWTKPQMADGRWQMGFWLLVAISYLLSPISLNAQPTPVSPASQAEVNAGTLHTKFVAPDTLKGLTAAQPIAQTITNSGTYFLTYGQHAAINLTNGGTVTVLGNGIIDSNWLSMGAVEYIQCDQYCPNFGWTAYNYYTNQWQSVTCNVSARYVMFAQPPAVNGFYQYTTNQSDVFNINASERLDLVELETTLDGSGLSHSPAFLNCIPALIHWTTPYFFTGFCGTNSFAPTLNSINGSSLSCGIWDVGSGKGTGTIFQMWSGRTTNVAYVTLNCAEMTSSAPAAYGATAGWSWGIYNTTNNATGGSVAAGGLILANPVYVTTNDVNNTGPDVDFVDSATGIMSVNVIGTFYDAWPSGQVNNQGINTNRLSEVPKAYVTAPGASYLPSYYSGANFNNQISATMTTTNGVLSVTNTSFISPPPSAAVANPLVNGALYTTPGVFGFITVNATCTNTATAWLTNYTAHTVAIVGDTTLFGTNYQTHFLRTAPGDVVGLTNKTGVVGIISSRWTP